MIKAGGFLHSWVGPNLFIPGKHGISVMESMVYWVLVLDRVTNNSPVLIGYPVTVFLTLSYLDHPFRLMQQVFSGRVEVLRGQKNWSQVITSLNVTLSMPELSSILIMVGSGVLSFLSDTTMSTILCMLIHR